MICKPIKLSEKNYYKDVCCKPWIRIARMGVDTEHVLFEFTPLYWGIGFNVGYLLGFSVAITIGPLFLKIGA